MKDLKIALLICAFTLIGITAYSQVEIIKNPDGSIGSIRFKGDPVFLDADGNVTSEAELDNFLKIHENYQKQARINTEDGTVVVFIEKVYTKKEDIIGRSLSRLTFSNKEGKEVVIVDEKNSFLLCFWDMTCGNCIAELTVLNLIANEFPELKIIAITPDDNSTIKKFMEKLNLRWSNITLITDYKEDYLPIIQSKVHPTTVLVSKTGVIEKIYFKNDIRQIIVDMDAYCQ